MWEAIRQASLRVAFQRAGVQLSPRASAIQRDTAPAVWSLNTPLKSAMSEYIRRVRPTLSAFVELVRGQTTDDYRRVWWWRMLADPSLNEVPLDYFGVLPEPDFMVATDASDEGLCALVPALRLELTYQFTLEERALIDDFNRGDANEFDINYRELLACALAVHAWASTWKQARTQPRPLHIHFRVDNTSAVAWQTKMSSRNSRAQVLIRLLSLWEQSFGLRISASHIRDVDNTAADAGSRRWSDRLSNLFAELTRGWTTTAAPGSIGEIENIWHSNSANTRSQIPPSPDTHGLSNTGNNGRPAAG